MTDASFSPKKVNMSSKKVHKGYGKTSVGDRQEGSGNPEVQRKAYGKRENGGPVGYRQTYKQTGVA